MPTTTSTASSHVRRVFADAVERSDPVVVRNPSASTVAAVTERLHELESDRRPRGVSVLASEPVLEELDGQFVLKSLLADLVEEGTVSLRAYPFSRTAQSNLLVTPTATTALVSAGASVVALRSDDEMVAETLAEESERLFEEGTAYDLRTPGVSRLRATLAEELGTACASDFAGVYESLQTTRGPSVEVDEVQLLLLLGAKHGLLFYDLSRWGEHVGLASKSTFSRRKSQLEERGLLTAERVPMEVGRPRHRLHLADDQLADATPAELTTVALSAL